MAFFEYYQIFLIPLFIYFLYFLKYKNRKYESAPTNWPIVGMLPAIIQNINRIHDYATEVLNQCGGTFEIKGPLFSNMDMLLTCDPANIHHIFSKRFLNYPKGAEFKKMFEILGEGIFNTDFEMWEFHRRNTLSLMSNEKFYNSLERVTWQKVETGLLPILDHFVENGIDFDMQDVLQRFAFDTICQLLLHFDARSLNVDLRDVPCEKALSDALEPLFYRHIVPKVIWKLQKWLEIGMEKKLLDAWRTFDDFIYPHISLERADSLQGNNVDMFTSFIKAYEENSNLGFSRDLKHFLRDTFLGLLFAGRDSLSTSLTWFFWLIYSNPSVEEKIRQEIESVIGDEKESSKFIEKSNKLVYLHAALCETLRLFPPIALELKTPLEPDFLPSGNYVGKHTKIIVSFYSTGRMESVWGKDCMEFKPERWISPGGGIKHESSFKFPAFNVGPRTCPGKKMSFIQMKMVAAVIVRRFHVEVIDGHKVRPRDSIMLKAKHGLRVRLSKRKGGV